MVFLNKSSNQNTQRQNGTLKDKGSPFLFIRHLTSIMKNLHHSSHTAHFWTWSLRPEIGDPVGAGGVAALARCSSTCYEASLPDLVYISFMASPDLKPSKAKAGHSGKWSFYLAKLAQCKTPHLGVIRIGKDTRANFPNLSKLQRRKWNLREVVSCSRIN